MYSSEFKPNRLSQGVGVLSSHTRGPRLRMSGKIPFVLSSPWKSVLTFSLVLPFGCPFTNRLQFHLNLLLHSSKIYPELPNWLELVELFFGRTSLKTCGGTLNFVSHFPLVPGMTFRWTEFLPRLFTPILLTGVTLFVLVLLNCDHNRKSPGSSTFCHL